MRSRLSRLAMAVAATLVLGLVGVNTAVAKEADTAAAKGSPGVGAPISVDKAGKISRLPTTRAAAGRAWDVPDLEWPPAGTVRPYYPAEALRQFGADMTRHLEPYFPRLVGQPPHTVNWLPWSGEIGGQIEDGQDYLTTFGIYRDKIGRTAVALQVEAPGHSTLAPKQKCAFEEVTNCRAVALPDGSLLLLVETTWIDPRDNRKNRVKEAVHYRLDGALVNATAYDYDPIFDGSPPQHRAKFAVEELNLSILGMDPALKLSK